MRRAIVCWIAFAALRSYAATKTEKVEFKTSDRCVACHNGLVTPSGQDVSIGFDWRSSIMANSSRDPYWQGSVRRETIDHPESVNFIENDCSLCHMPIPRYQAMMEGKEAKVFAHLPFDDDKKQGKEAADGVDCSVCHQISNQKLGTRQSFNGGFVVDPSDAAQGRPEYGPFDIDRGQARIMRSSTASFQPTQNTEQIKKSELCATCHTLYTEALGPGGKIVGELPEQMPYPEWLNSDYRTTKTCQDCHMTTVEEPVAITRVFGVPRDGMKRHVFVAANFFMQRMLNQYRDALEVAALPQELSRAAENTIAYLQSQAANVSIQNVTLEAGRVQADVIVENKGGHKLPTAYPSRRAWIHFSVLDNRNRVVFESGALRADGSIAGNDNDADPTRFEPHYNEITSAGQVQIFEDIMADPQSRVTTGILTGVRYLKDNRLLPKGFDKPGANKDIAVVGEAAADTNFTGGRDRVHYAVPIPDASGPLRIEAELWYEPIGFRWANNLKPYDKAAEPRRFTGYFDSMSSGAAQLLARASVTR